MSNATSEKDAYLPRSGPMPRPEGVAAAAEQLRAERFDTPSGVQDVDFWTDEFTALCPRTGQPDFCTVSIQYTPARYCIESKSLKFYLWAFRSYEGFTERVAARIAGDIQAAIDPKGVTVTVMQNKRGGIELDATAERGSHRVEQDSLSDLLPGEAYAQTEEADA